MSEPPDTFTTSKREKKTSLNIDYSGGGVQCIKIKNYWRKPFVNTAQ